MARSCRLMALTRAAEAQMPAYRAVIEKKPPAKKPRTKQQQKKRLLHLNRHLGQLAYVALGT